MMIRNGIDKHSMSGRNDRQVHFRSMISLAFDSTLFSVTNA